MPYIRLEGSLILTYRCNARCNMCNVYKNPTRASEEIPLSVYEKLPRLDFCNITGGEPFIRAEIEEIVALMRRKARRIVISTNGFFTDRILALGRRYPDLGFRVSLEGLPATNDEIRGLNHGFDRGLRALVELRALGVRDVGFAMTVQGRNARDLLPLYHLSQQLGMQFATATLHNSHYFFKLDNKIEAGEIPAVAAEFERLIGEMLRSKDPKNWFRAYFNAGLINYIQGGKRPLPCRMGHHAFFLDPLGQVLPCNGMAEPMPMGNLREQTWEEIWHSPRAEQTRAAVRACERQCWMIGSASPAMKRQIWKPLGWIIRRKFFRNSARPIDPNR
ncbi:MAG: Antilisterial bacteriocin subtilosin biosynthesis protein AlbA [candidate division BRC1 bacterium ADurb.BinA364]|nr:MAG: Antilisterial bacteriocin subtilosin biosynthesis protein AlbA [candidate division BRC1 bacterium ADurb.BinA364]